jgi:deoxyribodipyrimidine photolyase-related protein
MMEGDQPAGGQWNFRPRQPQARQAGPVAPPPAALCPGCGDGRGAGAGRGAVPRHFGTLRPFGWGGDRRARWRRWSISRPPPAALRRRAGCDAGGRSVPVHALISPYLNLGLLSPMEVCQRVEAEWRRAACRSTRRKGSSARSSAGANSCAASGRWRGRTTRRATRWAIHRALPAVYWGGQDADGLHGPCGGADARQAYAHHIQRLMVTGNFRAAGRGGPGPGA